MSSLINTATPVSSSARVRDPDQNRAQADGQPRSENQARSENHNRSAGQPQDPNSSSDTAADRSAEQRQGPPAALDEERYSRQILFSGIGRSGQQRLARAHCAVIGIGATGAAAASLLARAGVGTLTLIDRDFVEPSNLQRQVLFDEADARDALPKAEAARRKISLFNSGIQVHTHIADLVPANILQLLPTSDRPQSHEAATPVAPVDLVLDATDNFETRYLLNDFCVEQGIPWIYAAAVGAYAATMNILPRPAAGSSAPPAWEPTACLACLFPEPPTGAVETCDTAGILATAVNLAASIQVTEALKYLTGQPHLMRRTLLSFDLWQLSSSNGQERSEIATGQPNPHCGVCGDRRFPHLSGVGRPHITLCGRNSVQIHEHHRPVDLSLLRERLSAHADLSDLRANDLLLRFRRGPYTLTLFADGRAVIQGTTDVALARSLYARFIGS